MHVEQGNPRASLACGYTVSPSLLLFLFCFSDSCMFLRVPLPSSRLRAYSPVCLPISGVFAWFPRQQQRGHQMRVLRRVDQDLPVRLACPYASQDINETYRKNSREEIKNHLKIVFIL